MRKLDLSEFIRADDLVFDVGANVGVKTAKYLELGARVICFEPNHAAAICLLQRFGGDSRVCVETIGLYETETALEFYECQVTGNSTFSVKIVCGIQGIWATPKRVHVSTLEKMFGIWGHPNFVKIDVEGTEEKVISGMLTPVPFLSFEFNPNPPCDKNYEACINRLMRMGYMRFNYIINYAEGDVGIESDEYRFDDWVDASTLLDALHQEPRRPGMDWGDIYTRHWST